MLLLRCLAHGHIVYYCIVVWMVMMIGFASDVHSYILTEPPPCYHPFYQQWYIDQLWANECVKYACVRMAVGCATTSIVDKKAIVLSDQQRGETSSILWIYHTCFDNYLGCKSYQIYSMPHRRQPFPSTCG